MGQMHAQKMKRARGGGEFFSGAEENCRVAVGEIFPQTVERMDEFLTGECPHCGQAIEFPPDGNGQTVNCPTCEEPFVLKPSVRPAPEAIAEPASLEPEVAQPPTVAEAKIAESPIPPSPPAPTAVAAVIPTETTVATTAASPEPEVFAATIPPVPAPAASAPKSKNLPPFELACLEFERDPQFAGRQPTRDQIARAWAMVKMRAEHHSDIPKHGDVVVALKEIYKQFRSAKLEASRQNPAKKKPGPV